MGFLVGIGLLAFAYFFLYVGFYFGLEHAVDKTLFDGHFKAYGKKYKAVEIKDNG